LNAQVAAKTFWQLDVYWEDDGPEYDETGREVLHNFFHKPDVAELRDILESNRIFTYESNIEALMDGSGVLMNTRGECCQLTEITIL